MKYNLLLIIVYLSYAISFILPSFVSNTLFGINTEVWPGWKCAAATFALIFTNNTVIAGVALTLPNISMILLAFLYNRINLVFLILILIFNFISCSSWWFSALVKENISNLLPGYWLWFISIIASNIIFILSKQNRN